MDQPAGAGTPATAVVVLSDRDSNERAGHEFATLTALAQRLANLQRLPYAHCLPSAGRAYYVPEKTLTSAEALRHGIHCTRDLFGGVVPHPFVATKLVTHPAVDGSEVPAGWADDLGEALGDAVLPGLAAFSREAVRFAHSQLAALGPLRLKLADGMGGRGQHSVRDAAALEHALAGISADELAHGVTLELELREATTYSVGMIECPHMCMSYVGQQHITTDNAGGDAYGGSDLLVALGGFDAMHDAGLSRPLRDAIGRAQAYDRAMHDAYPGLFASRRNYDVVHGKDAQGIERIGVLEQSWRIGGATPAEIRALGAFTRDASLRLARTSCREVHGDHEPPVDCDVHYRDHDPHWGLITKYSWLEPDGYPS